MTRRNTFAALAAFVWLALLSTTAHAQSAITGVVKDASGAVLPGVTVEASSDALIEKSKAAVSDGEGVYRIVDLRPGTYVVTFSWRDSPRFGVKASSCRPSSRRRSTPT